MQKKIYLFLMIFTFSGIGFSQLSTNAKGEVSFGSTKSETINKSSKIVTIKATDQKVVIGKITAILGKQTSKNTWTKKGKESNYTLTIAGNIIKFNAEDKSEAQEIKNKITQIKNILDKYKI